MLNARAGAGLVFPHKTLYKHIKITMSNEQKIIDSAFVIFVQRWSLGLPEVPPQSRPNHNRYMTLYMYLYLCIVVLLFRLFVRSFPCALSKVDISAIF